MKLVAHQVFVLFSVWILYAATYLLRKPLGVIKLSLGTDLGLSKTLLGWLDTALLLPYAVVQMTCGTTADGFLGPHGTVAGVLVLSGISTIMIGTWDNFFCLLLALFLCGATQALAWPASCKVLSAWFSDKSQNAVFGLMSSSAYGGSIIATALATYLFQHYGWRYVYLPLSLMVILFAPYAWLTLRMPHHYSFTIMGKTNPVLVNLAPKEPSFLFLWRLPMVAELSLGMMCLKLVRYCIYFWLPVYLMQQMSLSPPVAGYLTIMFDVGGILGSTGLGFLVKKHETLYYCSLSLFVSAVSYYLFQFTGSWGLFYNTVWITLAGAGICAPDALLGGSVAVEIGEQGGRNAGAAVAGLINGFGSLGGVIEGPVIGMVSDIFGWDSIFIFIVSLLVIGSLCVYKAWRMHKLLCEARDDEERQALTTV